MRIWMRDVDGSGSLHPCSEGDPGAIAFDKVSSKETAEGRAQRIAAALNSAMMMVPWKRIVSHGTRVELRDSGGHYYDAGLDCVAEFHKKFDAAISPEPVEPTMAPETREDMTAYHLDAWQMGEALKFRAQAAAERGDGLGSLLTIRLQLIQEELAELAEAMLEGSVVDCLDALTDLTYVVDGTYLSLGLAHYKLAALAEVHRSNMSKLGKDGKPITSSAGRIVKGPGYIPPDLKTVLGDWVEEES
jgi:predicted HAD superfamily Cof-like phosphohydrolase